MMRTKNGKKNCILISQATAKHQHEPPPPPQRDETLVTTVIRMARARYNMIPLYPVFSFINDIGENVSSLCRYDSGAAMAATLENQALA